MRTEIESAIATTTQTVPSAQSDPLSALINAVVGGIVGLVMLFVDAVLAFLLFLVSFFIVIPLAFVLAFISIPITAAVIAVMFLIKSGFASKVLPADLMSKPWLLALLITVAAAIGSFGFLLIVMQWPDVQQAFYKMYGVYPEPPKRTQFINMMDEVYANFLAKYERNTKIWFYMTLRDGFFYFGATCAFLYWQQFKERYQAQLIGLLSIPIGVVLFTFVLYSGELLDHLANGRIPSFVISVLSHAREEALSIWQLLKIPFSAGELTFGEWLHKEIVKTGGSIYKISSIYPKLVFVLIFTNLAAMRQTHSLAPQP